MPAENMHIKEAVCIHTRKVYDSCKDKDCVENLRVYLTRGSQAIIDRAINVKCRKVELLWVYIDVEPVSFNRGFYTVDVKYFYKVTGEAFCGVGKPQEFTGLATNDKRVILFGSEGNARIFSSVMTPGESDQQLIQRTNMPVGVVEVVDPICLSLKLVEVCDCPKGRDYEINELPTAIANCFSDDLVLGDSEKRVYVTLGQFSIIKLERDTQLLIPAFDFCVPDNECVSATEDDPCDLFRRIEFPVEEFFPPQRQDFDQTLGAGDKRHHGCR
ncbi:MAG: hypothetical protein ACOX1Q_05615 [Eubacteriales bacterium]|jgi:hypothetical protein